MLIFLRMISFHDYQPQRTRSFTKEFRVKNSAFVYLRALRGSSVSKRRSSQPRRPYSQ
jgi:hypothetical protein